MPAFVAVVALVVLVEFGAAYLPLYAHRGQHRQLSHAARLRQMRARRVHGIRVHQPHPIPRQRTAPDQPRIPWQRVAADDYLVEAAGAAARRDRDRLFAAIDRIGQTAA